MKKSQLNSLASTIILIVLGGVLLLHPGDTLNLAVRLVGVALVLVGAVGIIAQMMKQEEKQIVSLLVGVVEILAGLVVLAAPSFVASLFPLLVGIAVVLYGISDFIAAWRLKNAGAHNAWALILAAITVILGVVLVFNPFRTLTTLVRVLGAVLIYKGVTGLLIRLRA